MKRQNNREYISYSSVEQMPDAKSSVLFINDSSQVFKDDTEISPITLPDGRHLTSDIFLLTYFVPPAKDIFPNLLVHPRRARSCS